MSIICAISHGRPLTILGPLVLPADLLFLLGSEVIGDVECLADLVRGLALDHVGNRLASNVEQGLDVKVVRRLWASIVSFDVFQGSPVAHGRGCK